MAVEVGISGYEIPYFVDGVDCYGNQVVEVVGCGGNDGAFCPWTDEPLAFHDEYVDVVPLPGQWPAVVGSIGQKPVDVTTICRSCLLYPLGKEAPFVDAE